MKIHRLSVLMLVAVLGLAIWSVYPTDDGQLPGTLRLAALSGPGNAATHRALDPFAQHLSAAARRAVLVELITPDADFKRLDLALLPSPLLSRWPEAEVLAWSKGAARVGGQTRPMFLHRRDRPWYELPDPKVIFGDRWSWGGCRGAWGYLKEHGFIERGSSTGGENYTYGLNPYSHAEAIAAVVHGAYDLAIIREEELLAALDGGLVNRGEYAFGPAGEFGGGFALVAGPSVNDRARRALRAAALNLDTLRFDESSLRVRTVLAALGQLHLDGFVPVEPLPGLRP